MSLAGPILTLVLAPVALLIFLAAEHQKAHGWRKCLTCSRWFDRHALTTKHPPIIARFAIRGHGICPHCQDEQNEEVDSLQTRSFSA
jgi:hypothetical protein